MYRLGAAAPRDLSSSYENPYPSHDAYDNSIALFVSSPNLGDTLEPGSTGGLDWDDVSLRFSADFPIDAGSWSQPASGPVVNVEFDYDGDEVVDDVTAARDMWFEQWASSLQPGVHKIRARVAEWSRYYGMSLYSDWTSYELRWLPSAPPIVALALENDTGFSSVDRVTSDPSIVGKLPSPLPDIEHLQVQYDIGRDGTVDGWTTPDNGGTFRFLPAEIPVGSVSLQARSFIWDPIAGQTVAGPWYPFEFCYVTSAVPRIAELRLLSDTGESSSDLITSVSTLVGRVAGSDVGGLLLQWDHNGDDQAEGTATSDSEGNFTYVPAGLSAGPVTIRGRTSHWYEYESRQEHGEWRSLTFVLVEPEPGSLHVRDLALAYDTGSSASDRVTSDPTVTGQLFGPGPLAQRLVEFDHNQDGQPDGSVRSDEAGHFQYTPVGLSAGSHTVQAHGVQYDYASRQLQRGAWSSLDFTLEPLEVAAPFIAELRLLSDSGVSAVDQRTENVTITGIVRDGYSSGPFTVQFDDNGDGQVDDTTTTDADGVFEHAPQVVSYGPVKVQARVVNWDPQTSIYVSQPWTSIDFVYEDQPDSAAQVLDVSALPSPVSSQSSSLQISGRITNESALGDVAVEIDVDGDGQFDFSTRTDARGRFSAVLTGLGIGDLSLRLRSRELDDATQQYQFGPWLPVAVVNQPSVYVAAPIISLGLINDTGSGVSDRITADPRIRGVLGESPFSDHLRVEFDHDLDGFVDGTAPLEGDRTFQYTPAGLEPGPVTLRARTKDYDPQGGVLRSDWTELSFTLQSGSSTGLALDGLRLVHDTGASSNDRSTSDATITGQVSAVDGQLVVLDFDHDMDGTVDGSVVAQGGFFTYQPKDLPTGWVPLGVRIRTEIGGSNGDWTTFGFVFSTEPDGPEAQALATAARSLDAESQAAQEVLNQELRRADSARDAATEAAQSDYERRVQSAQEAQREADEAAQQQFSVALAAAEAAYVSATESANAAYGTSAESSGESEAARGGHSFNGREIRPVYKRELRGPIRPLRRLLL